MYTLSLGKYISSLSLAISSIYSLEVTLFFLAIKLEFFNLASSICKEYLLASAL